MKTLLVASLVLMSTFASAFEGAGSSGGGDPLIIMSTPYPETKQLEEAINLSLDKVSGAFIPSELKTKIETEMLGLKNENKFQLLPSLIILGPNSGPESYSFPDDANKFVSLGGMTRFIPGAHVYFSDRVRSYSIEKFSELILHETLHHLLATHLTTDEGFVEELVHGIFRSTVPEKLLKALKHGVYLRKENISRAGLFQHPKITRLLKGQTILSSFFLDVPETDPRVYDRRLKEAQSYLPVNLKDATLFELSRAIVYAIDASNAQVLWRITDELGKFIQEINPGVYTGGQLENFGCKVKATYWTRSCPTNQQIRLDEVLIMK